MKSLEITLKRSLIGKPEKQRKIVRSLGLKKINNKVTHNDTPSVRGMIRLTSHMLDVREIGRDK